ncbi:hypothetical protein GJ629_08230 [Halapricum sp. CBA1109]|uniref:DUF7521 family protein n=1 Tax=Halapricum sp. CBA1109 TaxID=2668068 RepID=UPI0012FB7DA0|nr:hypothetical protein [Halapricum sp. CBA1109]MUV89882.1 hypothetical protein [Halapricum sp. CBA1109]
MIPTALALGAGQLTAVSLFAGVAVSVALALLIAVRAFGGYRRTRNRRLLALAVGLLCIVAVPKVVNIGLSAATELDPTLVNVLADGYRVAGLTVILVSIYAGGGGE